jgi:hypothetical protein
MKAIFKSRRFQRWILASTLAPSALLVGCHAPDRTPFDKCASITPGSLPDPNGARVRGFQLVQTNKAEMDDFVVYLQEWYMGGRELGPYGEYHIVQMAQRMPHTPFPVLVQVAPDPAINEHRRRVVIEKLAAAGVVDAPNRVILGRPEAEGLNGPESFRVYQGMLWSTGQSAGFSGGFGAGGGFGGGFGGGGFGGGGSFPAPSY